MKHLRVGTSLDKCVDIGAIIDEGQRKSVEQFVEEAKTEGAEVSVPCLHENMRMKFHSFKCVVLHREKCQSCY